jgi:hypothetical protein
VGLSEGFFGDMVAFCSDIQFAEPGDGIVRCFWGSIVTVQGKGF